ncbi:glycosyltransferase family 2 protein [Roseinatronobacter sp. NSM]|uniref:glycosyltransferase family 2 protein n=1 Tax=Roseinatronobacter sp. NSM TaxID=3457785 RepID=UPI00403672EB
MNPTVLTIIVNYKSAEMSLQSAQAALRAMDGVAGAITIVDNDSQDGSYETLRDAARDMARVRVIQSGHNGGFGYGNNVAIKAGLPDGQAPDFVYLLNPDAFPDADAIRLLRDHMTAHPQTGFAGSSVRGEDGNPHEVAFNFPSVWSEFETAANTGVITKVLRNYRVPMGFPPATCAVDWCSGASVMFRRSMLDQIGLFDETFFLYFEETELCHRARAAGWAGMYVPDASVMHIGSVSTGISNKARIPGYWFNSRAHYYRKTGGAGYLACATLFYVLGATIWKARRLIERKEDRIPPYFLRDLVGHTFQTLTSGALLGDKTTRAQEAP